MKPTKETVADGKMLIEARQHNIDATLGWQFMATTANRGVLSFNRLIERLARAGSAH